LDNEGDCSIDVTIEPGGEYTCSFTKLVEGEAGDTFTSTVTASGADDEGSPVSDSDDGTVTVIAQPTQKVRDCNSALFVLTFFPLLTLP
jgi:hypothetical protein